MGVQLHLGGGRGRARVSWWYGGGTQRLVNFAIVWPWRRRQALLNSPGFGWYPRGGGAGPSSLTSSSVIQVLRTVIVQPEFQGPTPFQESDMSLRAAGAVEY